ncbi:MAG: TonB-dependent receptor [Pseudomonadota bacterium]
MQPRWAEALASSAILFSFGLSLPSVAHAQSPDADEPRPGVLVNDEVIVTARRTEENAQDVPISIDVLSGDFIDNANITRPFELQFNVPGLVINNFGAGARFALRGVGDEGGSGLSVATHLNGVYLGSSNLAVSRMFDLQRVEVLKGPQGTLYGRNSTGGSINFFTARPGTTPGGEAEVAFGSFDTVRAEGHVDIPFERGGLRLAGAVSDGDGYVRNTADDRRFGEDDYWGLRGTLDYEFTDRLSASLMVQRIEDTGGRGQVYLPRPDFLPDPDDIRLTSITVPNIFQSVKSTNANLTVGYDFGPVQLQSITGFADNVERENRDCAGNPVLTGCQREVFPANYEQWSQEVQLSSYGNDRFDWLVGAFYFDGQGDDRFRLSIPALNPNGPLQNNRGETSEEAWALFGQGTVRMNDQFSVTGGLRYSEETRGVAETNLIPAVPTTLRNERSFDDVTWRVDAEYTPQDNVLLYAGVSNGFKSGGVTVDRLPGGDFDEFGPEDLTAYEVGIKSDWLDRRLRFNGAGFYYDFKDLQVLTTTFTNNNIIGQIDNAAKVRIYGVELQTEADLTDRFQVSGGLVFMPEREFVDFQSADGTDLTGNVVSRAPKWTLTASATYTQPIGDWGDLSARAEINHRSQFFFLKENDPVQAQDAFTLANAFLRFDPADGPWYAFGTVRNIFDEDYFTQVGFQSNPGTPTTYEVGLGVRF